MTIHFPLSRRNLLQWALLTTAGSQTLSHAAVPLLQSPKVYRQGMALANYWVSEKYDGVRGYWDGTKLWTRGGQEIHAPAWFTEGWPKVPMDGELWAGRGAFSSAVSTVLQQTPVDTAWRQLRFMAFDLPAQGGPFDERLATLQRLPHSLTIQVVPQTRATDHAALQALLDKTVAEGGEGLVLHRGGSHYSSQRNDDLLKFKPFDDAEARVVAHVPGHGKYDGMMGALLVETPEGRRFKLGTGFSDAQRRSPPAIGSWVTYRYRDLTSSGLPRFASYLRQREDFEPKGSPS